MVDVLTHMYPATLSTRQRSVVELEAGKFYYSDMRLVDISASSDATDNYNWKSGVFGLIRRISLESNGIEIDSCDYANVVGSFKNLARSNRSEVALRQTLSLSTVGYDVLQYYGRSVSQSIQNKSAANLSGYVELKTLLPFLEYNQMMMFPQGLRLVIEWETDPGQILAGTVVTAPGPEKKPVTLIVDEELRPAKQISMKQMIYPSWEVDRLTVPVADPVPAADEWRTSNYFKERFSGFNGKTCGKGFFQFLGSNTNNVYGQYISSVQFGENYQIYLDNKPFFPSSETRTTKLARLNDTWGPLCLPLPATIRSMDAARTIQDPVVGPPAVAGIYLNLLVDPKLQTFMSVDSWGAIDLTGTKFNDMQFEYSRIYDGNWAMTTDPITVRLFMQVWKALKLDKDGNVVVQYL